MKNLVKYIISSFLLPLGFMSCLKDDPTVNPAESNNVVEFANTYDNLSNATSHYPRYNVDLGTLGVGDSAQIPINLSYSGADMAPEDITVTLEVDTAALTVFNTDNGTSYTAPPAEIYSFPTTAVIKKGTQVTHINASIILNSSYDFSKSYALPLRIVSASTGVISGNFGAAMYSFGARNIYDGTYSVIGTLSDVVAPNLTGYYPLEMELRTYTGNSVALYDPGYFSKNYYHPIKNGESTSAYGNFAPIFYIDPATSTISSIGNYYGQGTNSSTRAAALDPNGINNVVFNADGSIKSFQVSYIMIQGGSNRTFFTETYEYIGPR